MVQYQRLQAREEKSLFGNKHLKSCQDLPADGFSAHHHEDACMICKMPSVRYFIQAFSRDGPLYDVPKLLHKRHISPELQLISNTLTCWCAFHCWRQLAAALPLSREVAGSSVSHAIRPEHAVGQPPNKCSVLSKAGEKLRFSKLTGTGMSTYRMPDSTRPAHLPGNTLM